MIKVSRTFTTKFIIDDALYIELPEVSLRDYLERKAQKESEKMLGLEDNFFVEFSEARWSWDLVNFFLSIDVEFFTEE